MAKTSVQPVVSELPTGDRVGRLRQYQRAIREWMPHLDSFEFMVMMSLLDRTVGWGHTRTVVSLRKVVSGDNCWGGMKISRRKLFYVLDALEAKNAIVRRADPGGRQIREYSVNLGWVPGEHLSRVDPETGAPRAPDLCIPCTGPVHLMHPVEGRVEKEEWEKETYRGSASPRPVPASADWGRTQTAVASTASRAANAEKLADRVEGVEAAWRAAFEEAHPQVAFGAWSVREKSMVKAKLKSWIVKDGPMPDIIDWAVRNWPAIIAKQFRWMTRSPAPKVPEIGFLLSFMGHFLECRAEGKLENWLAAPERTEFEKLTAKGLSEQEAAAQIGTNRAVEVMRKENEKVRIEARSRVRQAQIIEKRTEAMANLPPHPDSEVARKARGELTDGPLISGADAPKIDWANQPILDPNWEPPE